MLAGAATVFTYLQIVLGATVRTSGSGLGCPDWPTCHGGLVPPLSVHPILEYSHRVVGSLTGLLVLATCLSVWKLYHWRARLVPILTAIALALVVFEGVLGGIAVLTVLPRGLIAVHLIDAFVIFGLMLTAFVFTGASPALGGTTPPEQLPALQRHLLLNVLLILLLLLSGALVVGTGATESCDGWPYCQGGFTVLGGPLVIVQVVHRTIAGIVAVLLLRSTVLLTRQFGRARALLLVSWLTILALLAEVVVGAGLGLLDQPDVLKGVHVALATAVWAGAIAALAIAYQTTSLRAEASYPYAAVPRRDLS
ncbi:MAG: COX15/CtaA family protein [Chloroflexi bacterium]|nr:COX15/CtaA family protein [Chloroflexota bacterium]